MIGPFPWYYTDRGGIFGNGWDEPGPPKWNEKEGRWNEWRLRIPPEWRFQPLHDAPFQLRAELGLTDEIVGQTKIGEFM